MENNEEAVISETIIARISKQVVIQTRNQQSILVTSKYQCLTYLQPHENITKGRLELTAPGVMDIFSNKPFMILATNFWNKPIHIKNIVIVSLGEYILEFVADVYHDGRECTDPVIVLYK